MAERDSSADGPAADPRANYRHGSESVRRPGLAADLDGLIAGEVRFDDYSRQLYATDASIYEVTPVGVVFPTSTADVAAVVEYCADREIPVLPRGGGTSLAGQAVNEAVVLDFTRHMDAVLSVDPDSRTARTQAGAVLAELNRALDPHDLKFAPDPSTANRSAMGGAVGNNTTGAHSLLYGKTDAYVEELEVVLADGTVTTLGEVSLDELRAGADPDGTLEERLYAEAWRIVDEEREAVNERFPDIKRNVSGYNLDTLVAEAETGSVNLARLIVGSEGTLAVVTEVTVSLEPVPETTALGLLTYDGLLDAMADVDDILDHDPAALEVLDGVLVDLARDLEEFADVIDLLPDRTDTFLLVEFYADSDAERREKVGRLLDDRVGDRAFDGLEAYDEADQQDFWKMRKASTPILLSRTTDAKHIAFVEDVAVPPAHLPEFIADFQRVFEDHDTIGSFYAHAGPGCIHVRPLVDTKTEEGVERLESIADAATDLAVQYDGAVSGEHGDGRARTQWNRKLYGDHLVNVFRDLKTAVDPDWLLNPGTVCGDVDMTENLRFDPDYAFDAGFDPALNWDIDNGFQGMAELCHGCGDCRGTQETTGGVMCPTYRASQEEITSTRGRANLLRQAMSGDLDDDAADVEFMHEVLDLCIGCKGCSKDCPSEVDLAKLKVEVAHEHHQRHGSSLRDKLFANVDALNALGSALAPVSNWAAKVPGARTVVEKTVGIAKERSLPTFHRESLVEWFDARGGAQVSESEADRRVLLFPDSYTTYNAPEAGKAAVRVLEAANVHVAIPDDVTGSGRPPFSKGFLDRAREQARTNVDALAPRIRDGWDVVVVEPSDAVMFQSDYHDLLTGEDVDTVAANTYGIMEYLDVFRLDESLALDAPAESLTYHGHCHQKATQKDHHAVGVLRRAGYVVDPLDSGCCGMAGSFGYEAEHFSMSKAIGHILFEQVDESPGDRVVAPGASCRTQLEDHYDDEPPTPIELLAQALR
ncbi:FAD-binding and (Fe-S)-binding domain-containing protein [Haloplanus aerogenes]|uniref:D-lactate dehydrogenase (cytochrome) n=1 Tax=Haloplanus aerogenes TaxID=660522 RepID=A0A3M0CSU9_9EURY|nr:FAD-binding and (Fe-S)-binding domain-containing protein [Haloplanus aerogenes]AZH26958.1 FAD-binding oxidoreductase [Haloplanus aerogenes]RMB12611.1 FAD/FMN-containing dehydrogenase [Haloplanus aerogenes]